MKKLFCLGFLFTSLSFQLGFGASGLETFTVPTEGWKARDTDIVSVEESGDVLSLIFGNFPERWQLVEGPEVILGARTRFHKNRQCRISLEIKTSALEGYALQVRARQRTATQKEGGAFTRSLSPRLEWDAVAELDKADKFRTWAKLEGVFTLDHSTEILDFEIWLLSPKSRIPAKVQIRNIKLTETAEPEHLMSSIPPVSGNIFFASSGTMKAELVEPEKIKSAWIEVFDETGRSVGKVEGDANTADLKVALPGPGYYAVRATAEYLDGRTILGRTTAAVVGPPLSETVRKKSRLGIFRVWGDRDLWLKTGANWDWGIGGIDLSGYTLEGDGTILPPKNAKPLTYEDNYKTIFTIGEFPKWVMPDGYTKDSLMAPKDWGMFERLIEAFARQNPDLPWFCSYNEPDAHWRGSSEDFVKFHKVMASGVKKGNPNMMFYGPCMYSIRMDDLRKYDAMGLFESLDGLVMHAYVDGSPPEGAFIERAAELATFLKDTGRGDMPVFITEFGWCAEIGDWQKTITEAERSQFAPRSIALMASLPFDAIEYFVFKHASEPDKPGYSLLYSDNTPTPTYVAFVNLLKWLSWTQRGDGRWFAFSPKLHLTLFHGKGGDTGVAWNTDRKVRLVLPVAPLRIGDNQGRSLPVEGTSLEVGPAPVFFDLPDSKALFEATTLPEISVALGEDVVLPWEGFFAAPEITFEGSKATVSPTATPGNYQVLGKVGETFQIQPIRVMAPLTVDSVDFNLSPDGKKLIATAKVETPLRDGCEVHLKISTDEGAVSEIQKRLEFNIPVMIELEIPRFKIGQRVQGKLNFSVGERSPFEIEKTFTQTIIPSSVQAKLDWKSILSMDISNTNPYPEELKPEDISASLQTALAPDGFHLRVEVRDNAHHQSQLPSYMWNGDSIQFAFDVDADKEWQPNNVGNGYKGHRVFEYGVGLPNKGGKPMVWRWRADAPGFTSDCEEPQVVADVKREGTKTIYEVLLPWEVLGLSEIPTPGSTLGFSLVVNDLDDGNDKRRALRFGGGILESKKPEDYGKLHVMHPEDSEPAK